MFETIHYDPQLSQKAHDHETCKKLMKLEGAGPIAALGLSIRLGQGDNYTNGKKTSC